MGFVDVFNHWQWICSERLVMFECEYEYPQNSALASHTSHGRLPPASARHRPWSGWRDFPGTDSFLGWAQQQTHTDFEVSESLKLTRTIRHLIPTRLMTNVFKRRNLAQGELEMPLGPTLCKTSSRDLWKQKLTLRPSCHRHLQAALHILQLSCWLPMNCLYQEASMKLRISDSNLLNNPARCLNRSLLINMDLRRTAMSKLPLQCLIGTTDPFRRNPHLCSTPTMFTCTVTQRGSQKLKLKHESISKSSRFQRKDWNPILH